MAGERRGAGKYEKGADVIKAARQQIFGGAVEDMAPEVDLFPALTLTLTQPYNQRTTYSGSLTPTLTGMTSPRPGSPPGLELET